MTSLKAIIKADYRRHVNRFEKLKPNKDIILLGDSMMAYFPVKAFNFSDVVYNMGIPGDTTIGVLNRLDQVIRLKPKVVIMHIGLNDFVLTDLTQKESLSNILKIKHKILEHCVDSKVYVVSLTPINQKDFQDQIYLLNRDPKDAVVLNKLLEQYLAPEYFVNVFDVLTDEEGALKSELTSDGVHLNLRGYHLYVEALREKNALNCLDRL